MEIVLIRHTAVGVPKGTCYGWSDVPLADTFEAEATVTKKALSDYGKFDMVFTSPLSRAAKLAAFCGYPDAIRDERLKEMNMGEWEMMRYDDLRAAEAKAWFDDYMHQPTPGGESFPMLQARVADFFEWLRGQEVGRVAVFAHGGVLVAAGIYGKLFVPEEAWNHLPPYGGIIKIEI